MAYVQPSRLAMLNKLRCSIFQTAYNPTSARTGAKYLRARLRGPSMVNYYPVELSVTEARKMFPDFKVPDQRELERLEDVKAAKERGKGTPRKARTEGVSRRVGPGAYCSDFSFSQRRAAERKGGDKHTECDYIPPCHILHRPLHLTGSPADAHSGRLHIIIAIYQNRQTFTASTQLLCRPRYLLYNGYNVSRSTAKVLYGRNYG